LIVVDASAAILGLLDDGDARRQLATEELHAPHLIDSEVTHVLRRQELQGRIGAGDARRALDTWRRLGLTRYGAAGLTLRMWALRPNLSAYDATYVALAEALDCPLLTADRRLAGAPGIRCRVTIVR